MDRRLTAGLVAGALSLVACGGNKTPPFTGAFRVVNGITDSATLDASIANIPTDSQNIQFDSASQIADLPEGSYDAQLTPSDSSKKFSVHNVDIDHNNVTTILTYGTLAGGTQGGFTAEESLGASANGQAVIQVANAAYASSAGGLPNSEFSFSSVGSAATSTAGANAPFGEAASPISLASSKYEIKVSGGPYCSTGAGACPAIAAALFDSGPSGISLPMSNDANIFQLIAIDANSQQRAQYGANIVLLLIDNQGNSTPLYNGQN